MVMFYALVALCFSSGALAQIVGSGACPEVTTMKDFNVRNIQGRWFEAGRHITIGGMKLKCVTNDLLHGGGLGIIEMNTTAISKETGKMVSIEGIKIRVPKAEEPGKLEYQLPSSNDWKQYWILGSDAPNWMVGYSCTSFESMHMKYFWILTRQQQPTAGVLKKAVKVLKKQKLDQLFMRTDQNDCEPRPDSGETEGDTTTAEPQILY